MRKDTSSEDPFTRRLGRVCKDTTIDVLIFLTFVIMDSSLDDVESETSVWTRLGFQQWWVWVFLGRFFFTYCFMSIRQPCPTQHGDMLLRITNRQPFSHVRDTWLIYSSNTQGTSRLTLTTAPRATHTHTHVCVCVYVCVCVCVCVCLCLCVCVCVVMFDLGKYKISNSDLPSTSILGQSGVLSG